MAIPISHLPNIGRPALEVFILAGLRTVNDLMNYDTKNDKRLSETITKMKNDRAMESVYWTKLHERCMSIIIKTQHHDALPYIPNQYLCPLTLNIIWDPVVSPSGYTYEKNAIMEFIRKYGCDPVTRQLISETLLYPNFQLKEAIQHYLTTALRYPFC